MSASRRIDRARRPLSADPLGGRRNVERYTLHRDHVKA
jgi:hypothetical protein